MNKCSIKTDHLEKRNITVSRLNVRVKEANMTVSPQKQKPCPTRIKRNLPWLCQVRSKTITTKKVFKRRKAWTLVTKFHTFVLLQSAC